MTAQTLRLEKPFRPDLPWTEILLETDIPPPYAPETPLDAAKKAGLEVELLTADGSHEPLTLSFANQFVTASSPLIQWPKTPPPTIIAVTLRSKAKMEFRRIVFSSYDPRKFKEGVWLPNS